MSSRSCSFDRARVSEGDGGRVRSRTYALIEMTCPSRCTRPGEGAGHPSTRSQHGFREFLRRRSGRKPPASFAAICARLDRRAGCRVADPGGPRSQGDPAGESPRGREPLRERGAAHIRAAGLQRARDVDLVGGSASAGVCRRRGRTASFIASLTLPHRARVAGAADHRTGAPLCSMAPGVLAWSGEAGRCRACGGGGGARVGEADATVRGAACWLGAAAAGFDPPPSAVLACHCVRARQDRSSQSMPSPSASRVSAAFCACLLVDSPSRFAAAWLRPRLCAGAARRIADATRSAQEHEAVPHSLNVTGDPGLPHALAARAVRPPDALTRDGSEARSARSRRPPAHSLLAIDQAAPPAGRSPSNTPPGLPKLACLGSIRPTARPTRRARLFASRGRSRFCLGWARGRRPAGFGKPTLARATARRRLRSGPPPGRVSASSSTARPAARAKENRMNNTSADRSPHPRPRKAPRSRATCPGSNCFVAIPRRKKKARNAGAVFVYVTA